MANANEIAAPSQSPFLTQVSGPGKGHSYDLSIERVAIGRADDNELVLPHESVSRVHAILERGADGRWAVSDNQSKNGIFVNGEKIDSLVLNHGDVFQIGIFRFQFLLDGHAPSALSEASPVGQYLPPPSSMAGGPRINKRLLIYGVTALIIGGVIYYSNSSSTGESKDTTPNATKNEKTPEGFQVSERPNYNDATLTSKVPGLHDPVLKNVEDDLQKIDMNDSTLRESEQYFRRGQREFSNKNYQRAIDAFNAAITIYRKHPLARYYLDVAIHESEAEAEKHRQIAVKYFESLQYSRAIYHFREAINLMAHKPTDPKMEQCKQGIALATQKLQAVELFP